MDYSATFKHLSAFRGLDSCYGHQVKSTSNNNKQTQLLLTQKMQEMKTHQKLTQRQFESSIKNKTKIDVHIAADRTFLAVIVALRQPDSRIRSVCILRREEVDFAVKDATLADYVSF